MRRRWLCRLGAAAAVLALGAGGWLGVRMLPATEADMRSAACLVRGRQSLCLVAGGDTLPLQTDTVEQQGVWINRHWWWPSCDGRVLTVKPAHSPRTAASWRGAANLRRWVEARRDSMAALLGRKETERKELAYYLRSHGVRDEGYTRIAVYAAGQRRETDSLRNVCRRLARVDTRGRLRLVEHGDYTVTWFDGDGRPQQVSCHPAVTKVGRRGEALIIRTRRFMKPWGVYAVRNTPWLAPAHRRIIVVTVVPAGTRLPRHTLLTEGRLDRGRHDLPRLFAADGSAAFTRHGRFIGVVAGQQVGD